MNSLAGVYVFLVLLGLVVAVLWILMPFAVFGLKDLLRQLLREQQKTNELLREMQPQATRITRPPLGP